MVKIYVLPFRLLLYARVENDAKLYDEKTWVRGCLCTHDTASLVGSTDRTDPTALLYINKCWRRIAQHSRPEYNRTWPPNWKIHSCMYVSCWWGGREFCGGPSTTYVYTFPFSGAARLHHQADVFTLFSAVTMAPGKVVNTLTLNKKKKYRLAGMISWT